MVQVTGRLRQYQEQNGMRVAYLDAVPMEGGALDARGSVTYQYARRVHSQNFP